MPQLYKLASQRFSGGGTGGGLSPVTLSTPNLPTPSAAGAVRAPQINVNSGNVNFTPMPVANIQTGNEIQAASQFFGVLADSAFRFQERQDTVDAQSLVMQYEQEERKRWLGHEDDQGNWVKGQSQLTGTAANKAHGSYTAGVDETFEKGLSAVSPSVRQKAALQMNNIRGTYLQRAANHNVKQLQVAEQNSRFMALQEAHKEFEVDPNRAWDMVKTVAGGASSPQEKFDIMSKTGVFGIKKIYDNALSSGASEENAHKAAATWFADKRDDFPEGAEMQGASILRTQAKAIASEKEAKRKEALATYQSKLQYQGASKVYMGLSGGPATLPALVAYNRELERAYADKPHMIPNVLVNNYKQAFQGLSQTNGYAYAKTVYNDLINAVETQEGMYVGPPQVLTELKAYIDGSLKTQRDNAKADQIIATKRETFVALQKAETPAQVDAVTQSLMDNKDLKSEEMATLVGMGNNIKNEMAGEVSAAQSVLRDSNELEYLAEADLGYTPDLEKRVTDSMAKGNLSTKAGQNILKKANNVLERQTTEYKALKKDITKAVEFESMYYDPETRSVGFWSMLSEEEAETVRANLESSGKSEQVNKTLAIQSLMEESGRWSSKKENQGRPQSDFFTDFFSQKPDVKRGLLANIATRAYNIMVPERMEKDPAVETPGRQYEDYGIPVLPDDRVRREANVISVGGTTTEQATGIAQGLTLTEIQASKYGEIAVGSIPAQYKKNYEGWSTDELLALQRLRQVRQNIDEFSMAKIQNAVKDTMLTVDFDQWKESL